jgi:hypothetical protein
MSTTQTDTLPDLDNVTHDPDRVAHAFPWDATRSLCGIPASHLTRNAGPDARKCPECERLASIDRFNRR